MGLWPWNVEPGIFAVGGELIFPICEIAMADFETVTIVMVDFELSPFFLPFVRLPRLVK
jgi:hypothetical protein